MSDRLRTVIVDDEKHCIETLEWQIQQYCPEIEIVGAFSNPMECLKYLLYNPVDLLFLDIEMPVLNGFDLLNSLPKADFALVFTTAYDEFAIKAIKHRALDYLLKPIDRTELQSAVQTASKNRSEIKDRLADLMKDMGVESDPKISLPGHDGVELVRHDEIMHCESDSNYTHVYLAGKRKLTVAKTLKEMEELLDSDKFLRVHQSHLVNYDHVKRYVKVDQGVLILTDGSEIPVSRRKRSELMDRF